jgi:hypothetical protein
MHTKYWFGKLKGKYHLGGYGADGLMIFKRILEKQGLML